ncbi:hypothetical protein WR25_17367 [Diploscapter pachys]|uniref:Uncharacterized protein n=1 Tax=Diploscapter pachys TaxID=2018661 RepID=A0A2A2M303_9BILA|nr:hypothetical protein WR25_17367 [Diploscapter pachys]
MRANSASTIASAPRGKSCRTVVSPMRACAAKGRSSKPHRDRLHRDHVGGGGDAVDRIARAVEIRGDFRGHDVGGEMRVELQRRRQAGGLRGDAQAAVAIDQLQRPHLAHEGEPATAAGDQPLADQSAARDIVDADRAMRLARHGTAPHDQRAIAARDLFDHRKLVRLANQQHAVERSRPDDIVQPVVAVGYDARQQYVIAAGGDAVGEMAEQRHEERVGQMLAPFMAQRHRDADHTGALRAQPARHQIGAKPMFGGDRGDALARLFVDQRAVGERAGYRAGIDAGQPGDVLQGADRALSRGHEGAGHGRLEPQDVPAFDDGRDRGKRDGHGGGRRRRCRREGDRRDRRQCRLARRHPTRSA